MIRSLRPSAVKVTQSRRHVRLTVISLTYHWESLSADSAGPSEDDSFSLTEALLQQIEDKLVVQYRIRVVDTHRVGAVMEYDVRVRNSLAKVSLNEVSLPSRYEMHRRKIFIRALNVSTPRSTRASSLSAYHFLASGLVMSTTPRPGCHKSHLRAIQAQRDAVNTGHEYSLPRGAILPLDEISTLYRLGEDGRELREEITE